MTPTERITKMEQYAAALKEAARLARELAADTDAETHPWLRDLQNEAEVIEKGLTHVRGRLTELREEEHGYKT